MDDRDKVVAIAKEKGYATDGKLVKDLSFYKKEVNLIALAASYGYTVNNKKTGRGIEGHHKYVVLDGERSLNLGHSSIRNMKEKGIEENTISLENQTVAERIMVSKNQVGMFQFSSINNANPYSKGSSFDFIMYHNPGFQLKDCINEMNRFILSPESKKDLSLSFENAHISSADRDKAITSYNNISPLKDASFLLQRGLSKETVFSSEFKGFIYNSTHTVRETNKTYVNIAFPMVSDKSISGYEILNDQATGFDVRNTGIKSTINDKGSALWKSYFDVRKPVDKVVFSESPIDAMSYHELNAQKGKNTLYLSSCGSLQDSQISLIAKFFSHDNELIHSAFKNASLVVANDKDLAGGFFTNKMLSQLDPKVLGGGAAPVLSGAFGTQKDVEKAASLLANASFFPTSVPNQNYAKVCIVCPTQGENSSKFLSSYLNNSFSVLNSKHAYEYSDNMPFNVLSNVTSPNSVRFEVGFRNDKNQWGVVNQLLLEHKFGSDSRLKIEQPVLKDYNDDLRGAKNLDSELSNRFSKREGEKRYPNFFNDELKMTDKDSVGKNIGLRM